MHAEGAISMILRNWSGLQRLFKPLQSAKFYADWKAGDLTPISSRFVDDLVRLACF